MHKISVMFKANLITNKAYYRWRRFGFILFFPAVFVITLMVNLPWYWAVPAFLLVLGIDVWRLRVDKKTLAASKGQQIEISNDAIRILRDSGELLEELKIADAAQIQVKEAYAMPAETISELFREVKGKALENYIVYDSGRLKKRYDFVIDSNYRAEQLQKVIQAWQAKGVAIGMIEQA